MKSPALRDLLLIFATLVATTAPFLGRPFNFDEPVYVRSARWIAQHPTDFYGFDLNWTGTSSPAFVSNENPPLAGYATAVFAALVGWSEAALHGAFLLVAYAAAAGTYLLARRLTARPFVAALATTLCPAFLVTSTLANSDVAMLALFVWALYFWDRGLERREAWSLAVAGIAAGLCCLTKYFGLSVALLMLAYALARRTPPGAWIACLVLPFLALLAYDRVTLSLYGVSLVKQAAAWAAGSRVGPAALPELSRLVLGLTFTGGCAATALALSPALRPGRALSAAALAGALAAAVFARDADFGGGYRAGVPWSVAVQIGLWTGVGIGVVALALDDLRSKRDAGAVLLALWLIGTWVFTTFVNWTTNGRTVLPLVPALGILVARRLDRVTPGPAPARPPALVLAGLAGAAALGVALQWSDARLARSARDAAQTLVPALGEGGARVWFQGHWGFQLYAERLGALPLDRRSSRVAAGDAVIVPRGNSYLFPLPRASVAREGVREFALPGWISTQNPDSGAGFYAATFGPLPFAFGGARPARYRILRAIEPFDLGPATGAAPGSRRDRPGS